MLSALEDDKIPQSDDEIADDVLDDAGVRKKEPHIRCPQCRWRPRKEDRWACNCGHSWNTFDTRGCCPACGFVWRHTQCLGCSEWSRHEDWYGD